MASAKRLEGRAGFADEGSATADITVYDAIPGGQDHTGSLAAHAGG